jgi:sporadic carbohydrate cluster protein (TIGR04323 family)
MRGYRGYVSSRPIDGDRAPQRMQNLAIRDYAARRKLFLKLSATEWAMPDCFLVLEQVISELAELDGVIFYSLGQLPEDSVKRAKLLDAFLASGAALHAALENVVMTDAITRQQLDDMFLVRKILSRTPDPAELLG